jgi:hypothetical protein
MKRHSGESAMTVLGALPFFRELGEISPHKCRRGHRPRQPRNLIFFVERYFEQFFNFLANIVPLVNRNMAHPELPLIFWHKRVNLSFLLEASGRNVDSVA